MLRKISFLLFAVTIASTCSVLGVSITNFGSSSFTIDGGLTTIGTTQNLSSIDLAGSDLATQLSGEFAVTDVSSTFATGQLFVSGSVVTDPGSPFSISLVDSSFRTANYTGGSWTDIGNTGVSILDQGTVASGFDATNVQFVDLFFQGAGSSLSVTLDGLSLSAVPEPSAYAAIAGLLALGFVATRRRK